MNTKEKINSDLKEYLKSGKSFEAGVLRMAIAAFRNKEIEKRGKGLEPELSEEEIIDLLAKEVKKRKEAIEIYKNGNRNDLAEKELQELAVIKKYLPEGLSEEEIEKVVKKVIEKTKAADVKDFGKVMGEAMRELKGRADSSAISAIIKKNLS